MSNNIIKMNFTNYSFLRYFLFILLFYLFLDNYRYITRDNYLLVSIIALVIIIFLDTVLNDIDYKKDNIIFDDIDNLNDYELIEYDNIL